MKLVDRILGMVNLGTVNDTELDADFDMNLYKAPVKNSRRNIMIENIQYGVFSIAIFSWLSLIFIDLKALELILMNVIPIAIVIVLGMFKDKRAQEAYDKYAEWKEMRDDYVEILAEKDLYDDRF
jgi:hypothetical protein